MKFSPKLVLSDLDGTMIDSVPDLSHAVDAMMQQLGLPACGEAKVRHWVGNGVERLVKRALVGQLDGEPDTALYEQALPVFKQLYAQCNGQHSVLYPGVLNGLNWIKNQGYRLACITNKAEQFTLPLLKSLQIYDKFELILSGDSLPQKKPDPAPLLHAAQFFQTDPHESVMLGDSISDVRAARAAGFHIICVSYGYNHGDDIRDAQPDVVIDSFAELPQFLS